MNLYRGQAVGRTLGQLLGQYFRHCLGPVPRHCGPGQNVVAVAVAASDFELCNKFLSLHASDGLQGSGGDGVGRRSS